MHASRGTATCSSFKVPHGQPCKSSTQATCSAVRRGSSGLFYPCLTTICEAFQYELPHPILGRHWDLWDTHIPYQSARFKAQLCLKVQLPAMGTLGGSAWDAHIPYQRARFKAQLCCKVQLPAMGTLGGSDATHRSGLSSRLLASTWTIPRYCKHVESEPTDARFLSLSFT